MKNAKLPYVLLVLLSSNLFYAEGLGLNVLISGFLIVCFKAWIRSELLSSLTWWSGATLLMLTGLATFLQGPFPAFFLFILAVGFFFSVSDNPGISLPFGFIQSAWSHTGGYGYYFIDIRKWILDRTKQRSASLVKASLLSVFGITILICFLKLYQFADPKFHELTAFINLDWVSWGALGFTIFISFMTYGLFFFRRSPEIERFESRLKLNVPTDYKDAIQNFLGTNNERTLAWWILIPLCTMLIIYIAIDLGNNIYPKLGGDPNLPSHSEMVHQGVAALILSIVMVILLLSLLFRGQLTFSKPLTTLALFWLSLNLVLAGTTAFKNYQYVLHWGLTYKRIGVYIWLGLSVIGIVLCMVKLIQAGTFWSLIRNGSVAFLITAAGLICPNWNKIIAEYNLSRLPAEKMDIPYLISLGPDAYAPIIRYQRAGNYVASDYLNIIGSETKRNLRNLQNHMSGTTWRSLSWREHHLYTELSSFIVVSGEEAQDIEMKRREQKKTY